MKYECNETFSADYTSIRCTEKNGSFDHLPPNCVRKSQGRKTKNTVQLYCEKVIIPHETCQMFHELVPRQCPFRGNVGSETMPVSRKCRFRDNVRFEEM